MLRTHHVPLICGLAVVNLFLLVRIVRIVWIGDQISGRYSYRGHDFPPQLPLPTQPIPIAVMTVEESMRYPLQGYDSDSAWESLGKPAFGYVRLNPPMNRQDTSKGTYHRLFTLTMFHELHCLRMLNLGFNVKYVIGDHHLKHCLGYLREMVLCDADLTLEPADWEMRRSNSSLTDREGATHVCRDWEAVYGAVNENWEAWLESLA